MKWRNKEELNENMMWSKRNFFGAMLETCTQTVYEGERVKSSPWKYTSIFLSRYKLKSVKKEKDV
jgi:hypothetical protein